MKFFSHHIGDFDKATRHLTRIERSIYRDLMDVYYDTELPLTLEVSVLCRKIIARSDEEMAAVNLVLAEFFVRTPTGWYHERCEEELDVYRKSTSQRSEAGKASAAARAAKLQEAINGNPTNVHSTVQRPLNSRSTIHEPSSINHDPEKQPPLPPVGAKPSRKKSTTGFPSFLENCKAKGEKPIPDDSPVFTYAEQAGISKEFLRLHWLEFKDRYGDGAKLYKDWRSVFGKSVRGNWFKLWFADKGGGGLVLTTVGIQAQNAHRDKS